MTDPTSTGHRLQALDAMRGFVMLLMIVDHASVFFNEGRVSNDGAATWKAGTVLPLDQFLTRFITHLCAPTFLFLAGASIALSAGRRARQNPGAFDRDLLVRGTFIVALDLLYMSMLAGTRIMQVLYAIGASMIAMALVRRLSDRVIAACAVGFFVLGEALTGLAWQPPVPVGLPTALTLAPYYSKQLLILYPFVPWLCMMALGYVFARRVLLTDAVVRAPQWLLKVGLGLLALFAVVRGVNAYGNMFLLRDDASLAQWLHVSKYPPSLAYASLELGLMALGLSLLFQRAQRGATLHPNHPLMVFGQTALFFYLAHFTLLGASKKLLGLPSGGIGHAFAAAGLALLVLYPACRWYRTLKQRHPQSLLRYV